MEIRMGRHAAVVFEADFKPLMRSHMALLPCLIFFPVGTDHRDAHDLTLAWLRFGITLRWYVKGMSPC